jgi:hypothetical protein
LADEMDHHENEHKDEQNVNERTCHVEDDECTKPREEQNQREDKKYESHYHASIALWQSD